MVKVVILVLTALFSLIALPGAGGFRITMGAVVLFGGIHYFKLQRPILLSFIAGIIVCILRVLVDSGSMVLSGRDISFYFLEVAFYLGYGILYYYAVIKNPSKYPLPLVVSFAISDAGGNFFEFLIRHLAKDVTWNGTSLVTILLAASVRSILAVLLIWVLSSISVNRKESN